MNTKEKPAQPGKDGLSGTICEDGEDRDRSEDRDRATGGAADDSNDFPLEEGDEQNFFA